MNRFDKLAEILNKQLDVQKQLLTLENKKTDVLLNGSVEDLDNLLNEQQPLILSTTNLEKQRTTVQKEMKLEGKTLRQIISENSDAQGLNENFSEMSALLTELKRTSIKNNKILQSRLEFIGILLNQAGVPTDQSLTYTK